MLLIFTYGVSLRTWRDSGLLDREIAIYKKMLEKGYDIGFLTYGDDGDFEFRDILKGIEILPIYAFIKRPSNKALRLSGSFLIPFRLARIFKGYDAYKTNQMLGSWVAVIAKVIYGKRLVVRCGYEWLRNTLRESRTLFKKIFIALLGYPMEFISYGAADRIIVSAPSISGFIDRCFRPFGRKVVYIPNFVDTSKFRKIEESIERHDYRLLYVGRLDKTKNLSNLCDAISASGRKIGLDIIGKGGDFNEIKKRIDAGGLDIKCLGTIPNDKLPIEINKYPVFALVSYFENNPKSLLEAMACERVVVGSNVEGIKDLLVDNTSGILVSTDADGIKGGLDKAFGLNDKEKNEMGRNARDFVTKTHSIEKVLEKEEALYEDLAK